MSDTDPIDPREHEKHGKHDQAVRELKEVIDGYTGRYSKSKETDWDFQKDRNDLQAILTDVENRHYIEGSIKILFLDTMMEEKIPRSVKEIFEDSIL